VIFIDIGFTKRDISYLLRGITLQCDKDIVWWRTGRK